MPVAYDFEPGCSHLNDGEDDYDNYWRRDVGYARLNGRWGLALRKINGHHGSADNDVEEWHYNDAPRSYRIEALDKLPDLLEELVKNAERTAKKLKESTTAAQELAAILKTVAAEVAPERKGRR